MNTHTKQFTLKLEEINPPAGLEKSVFERIEVALEKKNLHRKIFGFSLMSVSIVTFIGFVIYTVGEFQRSGFYTYLSLAFSDSKVVLNNLSGFVLSLVDSLPFFAITITLLSILALLVSIQYATNSRKELSYEIN